MSAAIIAIRWLVYGSGGRLIGAFFALFGFCCAVDLAFNRSLVTRANILYGLAAVLLRAITLGRKGLAELG